MGDKSGKVHDLNRQHCLWSTYWYTDMTFIDFYNY